MGSCEKCNVLSIEERTLLEKVKSLQEELDRAGALLVAVRASHQCHDIVNHDRTDTPQQPS